MVLTVRPVLEMKAMKKLLYRDWPWAIVFLAPSIVGMAVFTVYPLIASFYISFTDWTLMSSMKWIGFDNYIRAFTDPTALTVFGNTVVFTLGTVPILLVLPLFLALALNRNLKGTRFFRAAYFLPTISSMVAMALVWQWMLNKDFGILNYLLGFLGIPPINWLTSKTWSMVGIIIVSVWKGTGYNMMLFLAGLQAIPSVYYEAADLDGCSALRRLWKITVPLLKPTTLFVGVMSIINSFQAFDQVMVITGGGPARSTSVLVHYLYQNAFDYYDMGYACALGWLLTILVFALTRLQFFANRSDYSIE